MKVPDVYIDPSEVEEALRLPDSFALDAEHPASRDPEHWALGPVIVTRDSGLIDQSNRDALVAHLRKDYAALRKDWRVTTCSHWAVGWVEHLTFRAVNQDGTPSTIFKVLKHWFDALSDYPVADDTDVSRREYEVAIERIGDEGRQFLRDDVKDGWEQRVFSWLWDHDQRALDNVDDQGPCPSEAEVHGAMRALDMTNECALTGCALEREDSCGACGHELPCTEDPVCVRGYLHRGGHEDKNGFVKPEDDEKMNNPQNGKRVRTAAQLRDTDGLLVHPDYLAARKPDTDATLVNAVPGYGGDVWRARHDDGDEAVYVIDEMEAL